LVAQLTSGRTVRAWLYREQLRDILDSKQINIVSAMLSQWCTNVMRSKVGSMKDVACMIHDHFDGIEFNRLLLWSLHAGLIKIRTSIKPGNPILWQCFIVRLSRNY
jgi:hypothetical protein